MSKQIMLPKWEDLTLSNGFIFSKVMRNEEICIKIIQATTDLPPIARIQYVEAEKSIDLRDDSKSVRLDVYIKDEQAKVYNVEMQAVDTKELPERARYYQSMVDLDLLEKGQNYIDITDSYVIFICLEDIFGRGLARYTFKNRCMELGDLILDDGTTKLFLNSKGSRDGLNEEAKVLLDYLEGIPSESDFAKQLESEVMAVKSSTKWRTEYMTQHVQETLHAKQIQKAKEEGIERGIEYGIERGEHQKAVAIAHEMLNDNAPLEMISRYTKLSISKIKEIEEALASYEDENI